MSRIANMPISIPQEVGVKLDGDCITVKGNGGQLSYIVHSDVSVEISDNTIKVKWDNLIKKANVQAGTTRTHIYNLITGVSKGFTKKLTLIGVGYRAQVKGNKLTLSLGFSNPVVYQFPKVIKVEAVSQTELLVSGCDKQKVGQVASEIRAFRPPEPYKGKGIRYEDEYIVKKVAKKK